jgi:hypothetical protein
MTNDAISSLRTLFFGSFLVLVLWFLSWQASSEKLRLYSAAVELHEWLFLRERLSTLERSVFEVEPDAIIADDARWVQRIAPNEEFYPVSVPLTVDVTWPESRSHAISLAPAGFDQKALTPMARVYRILGDATPFPQASYYALFLREVETVAEGGETVDRERTTVGVVAMDSAAFHVPRPGIRQVRASLRDGNRPRRWNELRPLLVKHGFVGDPTDLSSRDAALAAARAEIDPRLPSGGVQLFGVSLSVAQFFSAVGVLLAVIAFSMIGPLLVLRSSSGRQHSQSWILVLPLSPGGARRLLEWLICSVTLFWAASPLLVLLLQLRTFAAASVAAGWTFGLGTAGLLVASAVQALVARELRLTRLTAGHHSDAGSQA